MKLRCVHNSIRIRVRKSDLEKLQEEGAVQERVSFGGQDVLSFALSLDKDIEQVKATLQGGQIVVALPLAKAETWINTQAVGLEVHQTLGPEESLHILVEKDFPCLDREEEDKSDTFWELAPETPEAC